MLFSEWQEISAHKSTKFLGTKQQVVFLCRCTKPASRRQLVANYAPAHPVTSFRQVPFTFKVIRCKVLFTSQNVITPSDRRSDIMSVQIQHLLHHHATLERRNEEFSTEKVRATLSKLRSRERERERERERRLGVC
jgi:hypothetical protein